LIAAITFCNYDFVRILDSHNGLFWLREPSRMLSDIVVCLESHPKDWSDSVISHLTDQSLDSRLQD
jgi:hypothetical protein